MKRFDGIKNLKLGEGSSQSSVNMQMKMRAVNHVLIYN